MATEYKLSSSLGSIKSVKGYSGYISYDITSYPDGGYSEITVGVGAYSASDGREYSDPVYFTGTISADGTKVFDSSSFNGTSSLNFGSGGYHPLRTNGSAWSYTYRLSHTYSTTSTVSVYGTLYNAGYGTLKYTYSISFTIPSLGITVPTTSNPIYVKINDSWEKVTKRYSKVNGVWEEVPTIYAKYQGIWIPFKSQVAVKLQGAPSESFTLKKGDKIIASGLASDSSGLSIDTLSIEPGTYMVTGSVSGAYGYVRELSIDADGTYNIWPDGALYWHGKEIVPFTTSLDMGYGTSHATENTNYIDLYAWGNSAGNNSGWAQTVTSSKIDTSKYTTINYKIHVYYYDKETNGKAGVYYGYNNSAGTRDTASNMLTSGNTTFSIASPGTSTHIKVTAYANWGGYTGDNIAACYVHAIWGE